MAEYLGSDLFDLYSATISVEKRVSEFHAMGGSVIAEHVDLYSVADRLRLLGVDYIQ